MSTRHAPFIIQARDRTLWQFVGEHEIASFSHIKAKFWPDSVTNQTASDRLHKMERAGYITRIETPDETGQILRCYRVTRRACRAMDGETASRMYTGPPQ